MDSDSSRLTNLVDCTQVFALRYKVFCSQTVAGTWDQVKVDLVMEGPRSKIAPNQAITTGLLDGSSIKVMLADQIS